MVAETASTFGNKAWPKLSRLSKMVVVAQMVLASSLPTFSTEMLLALRS